MTSPLVSTDWLAERLDDPRVAILDASWHMPAEARDPRAEYAAGHIPGAVFFDIDQIADHSNPLPHMLPSAQEFATAVRRLGIEPDSQVVVYDSHGLFSAPRAWWSFRAMGHADVFVLDGGLPKWVGEGRAVETGWRERPHGEFKAHARPDLVLDIAEVRRILETGSAQLVDARAAARFRGEAPEPRAGLRSGHMPGALNVPWQALVRPDGTLANPDTLYAEFRAAGVDIAGPIVSTCGSGVSASLLALAFARLGRDDVAVYDGSWSEWGSLADTPVATGA
jgi:thiosulfate/3-mercaptopyruvate sulfurtransferase